MQRKTTVLRKNNTGKPNKPSVQVKEKCWEVELDTTNECGKAPKNVEVFMSPIAKIKIEHLMKKFNNIEWLAYLVGDGVYVEDIFLPKQKVSAGSVTNIDTAKCNRLPVVGVIHSHHGMGNNFSGTDNEWINQNNDISLCISKSGINGHARWKTPCGSLMWVNATVKLDMEVDFDEEKFDEEIEENIKEQKTVVVGDWRDNRNFYGYGKYGYYGYWNPNNDNDDPDDDDDELKSLVEDLDGDDLTLQEEMRYMRDSGMYDDEENSFSDD